MASELDLTWANAEDYYGQIDAQPVILTSLGDDPPSIMFKVRVNTENRQSIELPEVLCELATNEVINISIENGYGWLTIYDLSDFDTEDVNSLLDVFLKVIEDNQLGTGPCCAICKDQSTAEIQYSDGSVNWICPNCLRVKKQQRLAARNKPCDIRPSSLLLTFAGTIGFAVIWATMWFLYDYMFELAKTDTIQIPDIVLGIAVLIAVLALGAAIGIPLRRLKIRNKIILMVIASLLSITSAALGEVLNSVAWFFKYNRVIDVATSIQIYVNGWQDEQPIFKAIKVLLVFLSVAVIYAIAKREKITLEI